MSNVAKTMFACVMAFSLIGCAGYQWGGEKTACCAAAEKTGKTCDKACCKEAAGKNAKCTKCTAK